MMKSNRTLVVVAFSALGLAGWKGQDPVEPAEAPAAAEAPASAAPAAEAEKHVLLRDGRLLQGKVAHDEEEERVVVTTPIGSMRFRSEQVERIFATMTEVHAYKREQVPEEDMDEQIKLAQWCLGVGLPAEAREHLDLVLKLDPKHLQATAMKTSLEMAEARMARRQQMDSGVRQAGAEVVDPNPAPRPGALDQEIVRGARQGSFTDFSVVFDLPPNAALKRAQEFSRYVHPVLQTYCARCHGERYAGEFQLVHIKRKSDLTADALRANLDATLRLVDRETPGRSELLASSLRPHGGGANTRPIFTSSNDRAYQVLSTWVNNLRTKPGANPLLGAAPAAPAPAAEGEAFAADRDRITRSSVEIDPVVGPEGGFTAPPPTRRHFEIPPARYVPGEGFVADESGGADAPVPFAVSGVMPRTSAKAGAAPDPAGDAPAPRIAPAIPRPRTAGADDAPPLPDAGALAADEDGDDADDLPPPPKPKKPAKPLKLDPELLRRAMQQRNGGGQ